MPLIIRTLCGVVTFIFLFQGIKNLPLVEVAIITNTVPIFTAIFAYYILGEFISLFYKLAMLVSFSGVLLLILGKDA
jgi:drug/metabolite transporter (DMT)-like permease